MPFDNTPLSLADLLDAVACDLEHNTLALDYNQDDGNYCALPYFYLRNPRGEWPANSKKLTGMGQRQLIAYLFGPNTIKERLRGGRTRAAAVARLRRIASKLRSAIDA